MTSSGHVQKKRENFKFVEDKYGGIMEGRLQ